MLNKIIRWCNYPNEFWNDVIKWATKHIKGRSGINRSTLLCIFDKCYRCNVLGIINVYDMYFATHTEWFDEPYEEER